MLESQPLSTTIQQLISAPWYKTVSLYLRTMLLRFHVLLLEFCFKFECLTVLGTYPRVITASLEVKC